MATLAACQSYPLAGTTEVSVAGTRFDHAVFVNEAYRNRAAPRLHVYIGGDGSPWLSDYVVALDPTPRRALAAELMALDDAPSIYLGRPCYFGGASRPPCSPRDWTVGRYSARVVESLAAALSRAAAGFEEVVLVGYSGGGALAVLIAAATDAPVTTVVTLAANLDIEAWTGHHGYHPLTASENPAAHLGELEGVAQLHVFGAEDEECPPELFVPLLDALDVPSATVPGFDHRCCWPALWPDVLAALKADPGSVDSVRAALPAAPDAARGR